MSRLVARLETRGLVERAADPGDARACRIRLTAGGAEIQRRVGLSHARRVSAAMTKTLDRSELTQLRELCLGLVRGLGEVDGPSANRAAATVEVS
jgi:DNA-binding MarR family transcriptional regulator